jgi:hypothetical protein
MKRTIAAFAIAPLGLVAALFLVPLQDISLAAGLVARVIVAYALLVAVLPPYIALRALGYTRFWVAPTQGAVTAMLVWLIGTAIRWRDHDLKAIVLALEHFAQAYPMRLLLIALIGAIEVTAIWLIARPDRAHGEKLRRAKEAADLAAF